MERLLDSPAPTPKTARAAGRTQHAAAAKIALKLATTPNAATPPSLPIPVSVGMGGKPFKVLLVNMVSGAVLC